MEPRFRASQTAVDDGEDDLLRADTVPPPASGDAYSAQTVVREAPPEVLEAIRKQRQLQSDAEPLDSGERLTFRQPAAPKIDPAGAPGPSAPARNADALDLDEIDAIWEAPSFRRWLVKRPWRAALTGAAALATVGLMAILALQACQ